MARYTVDGEYVADSRRDRTLQRQRGRIRRVDEGGGFDADAWLDQHYTDRRDAVESGAVDAHLSAVIDAETSETVLDAARARLE